MISTKLHEPVFYEKAKEEEKNSSTFFHWVIYWPISMEKYTNPVSVFSRNHSNLLGPSLPPKYSPTPLIAFPSTASPVIWTLLTDGGAATRKHDDSVCIKKLILSFMEQISSTRIFLVILNNQI